jgi:hypothetical protein
MRHIPKPLFVITIVLAIAAFGSAQTSSCSGGVQKAVRIKTNNAPITTTSTTFAALPNASVTYSLPAGSTDTFVITFSAEARLINNASSTAADNWIELEVRDNGVAMQPQDTTSPLAFAAGNVYESHSATFCKRISNTGTTAKTHTFTVNWKVTDNDAAGNLQGWLDDSALHLEVSD